jgi:Flp pilus assembly protein TadG
MKSRAFKSYGKRADEEHSRYREKSRWAGVRGYEARNGRAKGGMMNIRKSITTRVLWLAQRLRLAKRVKGEEGTSLVELAISLPIMMTLLTGAASFSLALYSLQQLGYATTTGVQLAAANQGLVSDPCESAATAVESTLPNWKTTKLTFTMTWTDSSNNSHSEGPDVESSSSAFSCPTAGDGSTDTSTAIGPNTSVVLTVGYSYAWLPVFKFTPTSPLTSTEAAFAD